MRPSDACREARDALAVPAADATHTARVAAHRTRCPDCRAFAAHNDEMATAVRAADGSGLSDMARARILARLSPAADELATTHARHAARRSAGWNLTFAFAGVAAAATALALWIDHRGARHEAQVAVAPEIVAPQLAPYAVSGVVDPFARALLGGHFSKLDVPAGVEVRAALGDHAWLTAVGPARLVVDDGAPAGTLALRLEQGALVAEYDHAAGGTLLIHSPGATTRVVGTVFSVEALGATSRVAVLRGAVEVTPDDRAPLRVAAGQTWDGTVHDGTPTLLAAAAPLPPPPANAGTVVVSGDPAGARALLGGAPLGPTPFIARLAPGAVTIIIAAPGRTTATLTADIRTAVETTLAYQLADAQPTPTPTPTPVVPVPVPVPVHVPVPVPVPAPVPDAVDTADSLYTRAEAAMRAGDRPAARDLLVQVVRRFPDDVLADAALYELARMARADGDDHAAAGYLDELLARDRDPALREPARYLRCRLDVDANANAKANATDTAAACLAAFRRDFPRSPHDAEVLALLVGYAHSRGDCAATTPLAREYLRLYPEGSFAAGARDRLSRCEQR